MGMTAALVTMAVGSAVSAGIGAYSAIDSHRAAKAGEKASKEATLASAAAEGRAAAKEDALRRDARNAQAKEAQNPELADVTRLSKKRGVQSTYTAAGGSGAGMMKGTSLTPIGGGDTGAIGAV